MGVGRNPPLKNPQTNFFVFVQVLPIFSLIFVQCDQQIPTKWTSWFQGGSNAGHTVLVGETEYKFHLIPRWGKWNMVFIFRHLFSIIIKPVLIQYIWGPQPGGGGLIQEIMLFLQIHKQGRFSRMNLLGEGSFSNHESIWSFKPWMVRASNCWRFKTVVPIEWITHVVVA